MKKLTVLVLMAATLAASAFAQSSQGSLKQVLELLDKSSAGFKSVQADFEWDQYIAAVQETDKQSGTMYFRRAGNSVEMAADIQQPSPKYVLFTNGELQVFMPKANQVTKYAAGKNRADFESYLVLGFGGRGSDLEKSFEVRYAGVENIESKPAYKLELTPKSEKVRGMFRLIVLWIDQKTGMSLQQEFYPNKGDDVRLAKYTNIRIDQRLPASAFELKTDKKTQFQSGPGQ